ncbi:M20 family metallopeptidase [Paenarthrobacter sp. C1]|uniref:M20 family metallopeptidase n=1 Tax=Paenarthrobacter sp. C1 TaxID=3400220 RepID=UPI003BF4B5F0
MNVDTNQMLEDLRTVIECESPSTDLVAIARSADTITEIGKRLFGCPPERIVIEGRTHLRWRFGIPRVLVLCHHDTVWPIGSLIEHPFEIDGDVLRGPGSFDMKVGLVMALHAIAALPNREGVSLLVTGDEELGSPSSRQLIEDEAHGCGAALVLEASADAGALKVARKGVSLYEVVVQGRAAHAGLEPERGVNASIEAAHQILTVASLGDAALGTTVTPTLLRSGTTTNTVPAASSFAVDVRVRTLAEQHRVDTAIGALAARLPDAVLNITGGANRPPLEESAAMELFARASRLAEELGIGRLQSASVGGASDGNFTAGIGVPTLDGLGAVGGGAHAINEHALVSAFFERTRLVHALIAELIHEFAQTGPTASESAR